MPANFINLNDFYAIAPEILFTIWGLLVLTIDFSLLSHKSSEERGRILGWLSLTGTLITLLYMLGPTFKVALSFYGIETSAAEIPSQLDPYLFHGAIAGDALTRCMNIVIALLLAMVIVISMSWSFTEHWGEYFALLFWAGVGMMLLIASDELLTLFLTLEMMTLCLYLCTAFEKGRRRSAEGGLKYFVYGSVSSALFLFGLSLVYGQTGTTRLDAIESALLPTSGRVIGLQGNVSAATAVLLILVGFGFKVAAVPFHQWAPDAYEGAPSAVTAWIASGSKIASFIAMMKVLIHGLGPWARQPDSLLSPGWIGLVAVIAAATMTYGNFAALAQRSLKRMLAYSSIAHAGYILVGVLAAAVAVKGTSGKPLWNPQAAGAVLYYLVIYGVSTVGAFAVVAWLSRDKDREDIDDLNGLGFRSPGLAVCIVVLMLSLIGVPPLAGFFGKLYMFMEALNAGEHGRLALLWLVALALLNSVVSAFYYVRVLKAMFLRQPDKEPIGPAPSGVAWPIVLSTLTVVVFGVFPAPLLEAMGQAAIPMLSSSETVATIHPPSPILGVASSGGRIGKGVQAGVNSEGKPVLIKEQVLTAPAPQPR
jgi:NADH-quinone oxidoreductase subunit N